MLNITNLLKNKRTKNQITMAKIPDAFVFSFLVIFMLQMFFVLLFLLVDASALAADKRIFQGDDIGTYLINVYNYGIGLIGFLAALVMMWGGLMWSTSGGDSGRVGEAKAWIAASLSGLVLTLSSVMILGMINPQLTKTTSLNIPAPKGGIQATAQEASQAAAKEANQKLKEATRGYCCNNFSCSILINDQECEGQEVSDCNNCEY